jgi:hypothetical protein
MYIGRYASETFSRNTYSFYEFNRETTGVKKMGG